MAANIKLLLPFTLLILWPLAGCGDAGQPSDVEILATADAIRAMTPEIRFLDDRDLDATYEAVRATHEAENAEAEAALEKFERAQATNAAEAIIEWQMDEATQSANSATAEAAEWDHQATLEAEYLATVTDNARETPLAEDRAARAVRATATALEALIETVLAQDQAMLAERTKEAEALATAEAGQPSSNQQDGCPDGCTTYPTWCEPAIKGNVSFNSGERIYHMQGDDFYDETKIDPAYGEYYFCTPQEAEAAGFRRAYN